jgi:hypothetical protein
MTLPELLEKWTQLQAVPDKAGFTVADMLGHISEEISVLEKLLNLRCYKIPGTSKDARELLQDRLQELRDLQSEE